MTLHCEEDCSNSEDPNCLMCPLTDPVTLSLTIGSDFTSSIGDANFDGSIDVLDIVELVAHIINSDDYYDWGLMFFISDLNTDYILNIQDVILTVNVVIGESNYNENCDVNSDGAVDVLDVVQIINFILYPR